MNSRKIPSIIASPKHVKNKLVDWGKIKTQISPLNLHIVQTNETELRSSFRVFTWIMKVTFVYLSSVHDILGGICEK